VRNVAASVGLVVNDYRLANILAELFSDQPGRRISRAAGREPDHQAHSFFRWKVLRCRCAPNRQ
jgi:hypothetical protein